MPVVSSVRISSQRRAGIGDRPRVRAIGFRTSSTPLTLVAMPRERGLVVTVRGKGS